MSSTHALGPGSSSAKSPSKSKGSKFEQAVRETTVLATEAAASVKPGSFLCALDCFMFLVGNRPVSFDNDMFTAQNWSGISAVGAVASLLGEDGAIAQCGWFNRVTWLWLYLPVIVKITMKEDARFRGGEKCLWLETPLGGYAMMSPHMRFGGMWDESLEKLGREVQSTRFQRWPVDGPRPCWWKESDPWPVESRAPLKRPAPTGTGDLQTPSQLGETSKRQRRPSNDEHQIPQQQGQDPTTIPGHAKSQQVLNPWSLEHNLVPRSSTRSTTTCN